MLRGQDALPYKRITSLPDIPRPLLIKVTVGGRRFPALSPAGMECPRLLLCGSRKVNHSVLDVGAPSDNKVRANQLPRSVRRAEPRRFCTVSVNIPSRARSAVVVADIGLPLCGPCQAPSFLFNRPALKQLSNAYLLPRDSPAIGACCSLGALASAVPQARARSVVLRRFGPTASDDAQRLACALRPFQFA
jgi:hypothetical protein